MLSTQGAPCSPYSSPVLAIQTLSSAIFTSSSIPPLPTSRGVLCPYWKMCFLEKTLRRNSDSWPASEVQGTTRYVPGSSCSS